MDAKFVQERLISLIAQKNISEMKMSQALGLNDTYINSITSGRSLPKMDKFFKICEYLDITPSEFFYSDEDNKRIGEDTVEQYFHLSNSNKTALSQIIRNLK